MTARERRQRNRRQQAKRGSPNQGNQSGTPSTTDTAREQGPRGRAGPGGPSGRGSHQPGDKHGGKKHHISAYRKQVKAYRKELRQERKRREKNPYVAATKAKAGKKAPFVKPFMNAEDLMAYAQAHGQYADTLNQLDTSLENQRISSEYEKANITKSAISDSANASDEAAARGLAASSIRDAELYDIDATAGLRKNYLDTQLSTLAIQNETQKVAARNAWDDFQRGMNQKEVQNAQDVMTNTGKWLVNPVKARAASGYKPKPIGPPPKKPPKPKPQLGGGGGGIDQHTQQPQRPKPPGHGGGSHGGTPYPGHGGGGA